MQAWLKSAARYCEPRVLGIFFLSFSSGLPFLLTLSTLSVWLTEAGVSKTTIGVLILATAPYTLKILWAPFVDRLTLPVLGGLLGKRRSWLLVSQVGLVAALIGLGAQNPAQDIMATALMIFLVSFCSASQDCVLDAYRVEILGDNTQGLGAGISILGYRMGMFVSSTGALYLASYFSWAVVYAIMAGCVVVGVISALCNPEPTPQQTRRRYRALLPHMREFLRRKDLLMILGFILLFKVGDTVLNVMSARFMLELGFSKIEIANVAKFFGITFMVIGGLWGGVLLTRYPTVDCLLISACLQVGASILFMVQAQVGYNLELLIVTIGIENLACGLGAAGFIAFITSMCNASDHTATDYSFFSSFASMARLILSLVAGILADQVNWETFYGLVAIGCLPSFIFLMSYRGRFIAMASRLPVLKVA